MGENARSRRCIVLLCCFVVVTVAVAVPVWYFVFRDEDSDIVGDVNDFFGGSSSDTPTLAPGPAPTMVGPAPTMVPTVPVQPTPRTCNGLANLCDVPVNEVLFATAHNANSHPPHAIIAAGQDGNMKEALEAGVFGLNTDIGLCLVEGAARLSFVHGFCSLGFSDLPSNLQLIHDFLDQNPDIVIIMPTQINDRTGGLVELNELFGFMQNVKSKDDPNFSFADRLYEQENIGDPWPTLGDMIDSRKQVLFMHYSEGGQSCADIDCPAGFHDWFVHAAETQFEFVTAEALMNDPQRACEITRGGNGQRDFFGINVFTQIASTGAAGILNEGAFLESHLEMCASINNGLNPNLVLVDFWSIGDVVSVVQERNRQL